VTDVRLKLVALVAGGLVLGVLAGLLMVPGALERVLPNTGLSIGQATIGGPFSLVDHTGKAVTDKDFRGRFMLIYFGFTFCPDVCPAGLQVASAAIEKLGKKGERVVPIFITVDPERDTVKQMASYVSSFHPRLVGLTGTPEQIAAVAKAYRVYYRKVKDERSSAPYTVDHSSIFYLMDPQGKFVTHFTHATPVDKMVETMAKHLQ
jgi:protein SCO1/2